jgi:hypothetical protein
MSRDLKVTIEPVSGTHNYFVVKVADMPLIHGEAKKISKSRMIPDALTKIYASSLGVGTGPKYRLTIDLPGNTEDHSNVYILNKGFHEITYYI